MISQTAIVHSNVELGENVTIEDFCIVGAPFIGMNRDTKTIIGDNAYIRSHTVIYAGNDIGKNFQTGNKANIRELNSIGNNVSIGTLSVIEHHVTIENNVRIHSNAFIPEFTLLEDSAWLGPNVVLTNARYPKSPSVKNHLIGPRIGVDAKIGANATILPGINVGRNALVGAGSVVTKDVEDDIIVAGNPAKFLQKAKY